MDRKREWRKEKKKQLPITLLQEHPSPEKFSYGQFMLTPPPTPLEKNSGVSLYSLSRCPPRISQDITIPYLSIHVVDDWKNLMRLEIKKGTERRKNVKDNISQTSCDSNKNRERFGFFIMST